MLVGGPKSLFISELPRNRRGRERLRGARLIHTRLNNESVSQDDLMDLLFLRLDAIGVVHVDAHGGGDDSGSCSHSSHQ